MSLKPPYTEIACLLEISQVERNLGHSVVIHVPFETCTCVEKNLKRIEGDKSQRGKWLRPGIHETFFALFQLAVGLQRHRFNTFRGDLGHKLWCNVGGGTAELLQNKKMQSIQTQGRKTNIPGFRCPFVDP